MYPELNIDASGDSAAVRGYSLHLYTCSVHYLSGWKSLRTSHITQVGKGESRYGQRKEVPIDSVLYQELFLELEAYEKLGVRVCLEDMPASSGQVADACFLCEDTSYMRDYILEGNRVSEIHFHKLQPLTDIDRNK